MQCLREEEDWCTVFKHESSLMQTLGANSRGNTTIYVAMCLLISAANSLFQPVLAYFFNTELHFSPFEVSIAFMLLPVATILIVQTVARFSDMGLQRPAIICLSAICGIGASIMLYMRPSFWFICTIGLFFLGSYSVSFPQIYASTREYAIKYLNGSLMFATFMRALASVSWVVGPPVAYSIATGLGFDTLFLATAVAFGLICVTSFLFLPNVLDKNTIDKSRHIKWWTNRSVMMLFISLAFMFMSFSSYINTMPLYFTQELHLDKDVPGYMLGLAAFIEIPLMFIAARMSRRIGLRNVLVIGGLANVLFLYLLLQGSDPTYFLIISFFAALYIAFVATMGMVFFQELLPDIPGQATSLYINASVSGQIAGGALISLAESGTYTAIYQAGIFVCSIGVLFLFFVKKPEHTSYK